ncbi:MAG: hypothetical protein R3E84_14925 [Pseudomonadales bacterium]
MRDLYQLLLDTLRQMWRFRRAGMTAMWTIGLLGGLLVLSLPNVYESQAKFYIDASSRLRVVVSKLGMSPNVSSPVFLVRQALLGRPQIEAVIHTVGLDDKVRDEEDMEELVGSVMKRLELESGSGDEGQNLFTVTYQHTDRDKAVAVVEHILEGFENNVVNLREKDSSRAGDFLVSQLDYYRNLLSETETKLESFKRENPGFVPTADGSGGVFERLQTARGEVARIERARKVESNKRDELRRQLSKVDPYAAASGKEQSELNSLVPGARTRAMISQMEAQRGQLLLSFTKEHPDVAGIDQQLDILRDQLNKELSEAATSQGPDGARQASNPVYVQIQLNLSQSNLAIAELDSQLSDARKAVQALETRMNSAPELERAFIELTRDYDKWRGLYDEVRLQAEKERIGRVGNEQDVITFNVIEPPKADITPVSPKRLILLIAVFVVSLAVAGGLTFVLNQLNPAYSSEGILAREGIPVLGSVSMFISPAVALRRKTELTGFLTGTLGFVALYAAIVLSMNWTTQALDSLLR